MNDLKGFSLIFWFNKRKFCGFVRREVLTLTENSVFDQVSAYTSLCRGLDEYLLKVYHSRLS